MTVYVDDMRLEATVGRLSARWSHMFVGPWDDIEELHVFAANIGLLRAWFQDKPWPMQHYDVTDTKRRAAIRSGAVQITYGTTGRIMLEARTRGRDNPPSDMTLITSDQLTEDDPLTLF